MSVYLWIDGVDGPVKRGGKKWMELDSVQQGVNRKPHYNNDDSGKAEPKEFTVSKSIDVASSTLFKIMQQGKPRKVVLEFTKDDEDGGEQVYLTITLEDMMISSYSSSAGGERLTEHFSMNFTKMTMKSTEYKDYRGVVRDEWQQDE